MGKAQPCHVPPFPVTFVHGDVCALGQCIMVRRELRSQPSASSGDSYETGEGRSGRWESDLVRLSGSFLLGNAPDTGHLEVGSPGAVCAHIPLGQSPPRNTPNLAESQWHTVPLLVTLRGGDRPAQ